MNWSNDHTGSPSHNFDNHIHRLNIIDQQTYKVIYNYINYSSIYNYISHNKLLTVKVIMVSLRLNRSPT